MGDMPADPRLRPHPGPCALKGRKHRGDGPPGVRKPARAYIGLGSNLDGPRGQLARALRELDRLPGTRCVARSASYHSAPMGPADQPDYVNAVALIETRLDPYQLLSVLHCLERAHGRVRSGRRWGPRPLDLDILIYGDLCLQDPRLELPHPGLPRRNFVLYPLEEISPRLRIPGLGPVADLVAACPRDGLVRLP